ncbi:uncharacterized protein LOC120103894 isoform X1 [Phoenix dactylifera]|uniref:Uncharacterized protein LOC120103894 isoform X1 n=1 Tax=Phoenix dactylifera TaxID=42345 RepID=A0A8B8J4T6_PHODC|nr:uncharacterized protein LOC120103894 isoform X1 [Phoenix dactylifera]
MEDEERTAPRNQDVAAEGTPMARSSSSTTSGPGCSKPTPRSPSALSSSDKNSVLLSDWWLVKVEGGAEGKRLAVSGFTTGQQAMRIFSSAPILKRYDAYNLETADGITVIILGLINKARTHDNGFPPEVCNRFLVGFPYNWDYYADKYFRRSSISASNSSNSAGFGGLSKDSADGAGHTSAVCVNVFPFGRLCDILITSGGTLTRNLIESLKKLFGYPSLNPTAQKPSLLPVETHSECDTDKSDSKHENSKGFATVINHDAEGHATSHGEKGYYAMELHAGDVPIENSNLNHDISHYSLMHENRETATQPVAETTSETETGTDMQMETLLANIKEVEKDNNMLSSVPVDCDDVDHVPACIEGKVNAESRIDSSCVRMKCLLEDSLLKESNLSDLRHDEELGDDAVRRQHCVENLRMPNVGFSDDLLVEKDCDPKTANSLKVTMNAGSQNSLDSDVTEPLKVSLREEGVGTRSKISSQNEEMVPSILSASQGDADSHHVKGRPWDLKNSKAPNFDFTGISKDSSSNEIDDMCYSILEKIECCKLPAVKDPTSQIGTAFDMTITKSLKHQK